jgi:hypothetical protein
LSREIDPTTARILDGGLVAPSELTPEQLTEAFAWEEQHKSEAFKIRARAERELRDAWEKEDLRDAWLKDGGDEKDFEKVYEKLTAEAKAERLKRMDEEAKFSFNESILRGF